MPDHRIHALLYDPFMELADRAGMGRRRQRLVEGAQGRVLEVGGGTGRNLAYYGDVDSVVVLEPDAAMRRRLVERVGAATVPIEVKATGLEDSALAEASFDTVIASLVLCTVPDQAVALAEMRRLLRPDGRLLFLEHVLQPGWQGRLQMAAAPAWSRVGAGCRLDRPTLDAIRQAGFAITDCERSGVLVQGTARISKRRSAA